MKKNIVKIASLGLLVAMLVVPTGSFAQRGMRMKNQDNPQRANCKIPNLTEDQQAKMTAFKTKHLKEVTPIKNQLAEKRARLNTLQSEDKHDIVAINKTIDEISALKAQMMKKAAAHRVEVSSILTDDQKVIFNSASMGRGKGMRCGMKGMQKGMGRGMGPCGN